METKELKPVDIAITTEEVGEKKVKKHKIILKCKAKSYAALRVFTKEGNVFLYASDRLRTLKNLVDRYELDLNVDPEELIGKEYELRDVDTKELLMTGVIKAEVEAKEKAEAKAKK